MRLWESPVDSLAVIAACTSYPTLRDISFWGNDLEHAPGRAAIDATLDALEASIPGLSLTVDAVEEGIWEEVEEEEWEE